MLNKLLFKNQDKKQLIIAIIGAFMGITFLITSIHYIIKVNDFGQGADVFGPNTIIVQKKVTNASSLNLTTGDAITQANSTVALDVSGITTLESTSHDITLNSNNNHLNTVSFLSADNVLLTNADALDLGFTDVTGTFNVSSDGAITQSDALMLDGASWFTANGDITLNDANFINGTITLTGHDISVQNINPIEFGDVTATGNFNVIICIVN